MLALGLVFPVAGTISRVEDRFPPPVPPRNTLDGMAFMRVGRYSWPNPNHVIELRYDYEAIRWLQDHITGTPVLAEAPASWYTVDGEHVGYDYYLRRRPAGLIADRIADVSGPAPGRTTLWRTDRPREALGREFWETTDLARLRQIIAELHVGYIYIGQLERILFNEAQLAKFDALVELGEAEIVFQNDGVTILKVERGCEELGRARKSLEELRGA